MRNRYTAFTLGASYKRYSVSGEYKGMETNLYWYQKSHVEIPHGAGGSVLND